MNTLQINQFSFTAENYHKILCNEFPDFLRKYLSLPVLTRLKGVGLLCGTDWTPLFHNSFFYSRFDHSVGTALIAWNFTHDKKQALASLFHDVSTPAFSHVNDFRKGDALNQEATETDNEKIIYSEKNLQSLLQEDDVCIEEICDYHKFNICDNNLPALSSDRLEYMFPSGASLNNVWTLDEVKAQYEDICVLKNEQGLSELGFSDSDLCLSYTKKFLETSLILQKHEDKIAMQLMADVLSEAIKENILVEDDLFILSEKEIIDRFSQEAKAKADSKFSVLYNTFRKMKAVERSDCKKDGYYNLNIEVKKRYINSLVKIDSSGNAKRISEICDDAKKLIDDFMGFKDSEWGCVKLAGDVN